MILLTIVLLSISYPAFALDSLKSFNTKDDSIYKIKRAAFYSDYSDRLPWNNSSNYGGMQGYNKDQYPITPISSFQSPYGTIYKNTAAKKSY